MGTKRTTFFIAAIAVQMAMIVALIAIKATILLQGTEIMLRVTPVDPRSPLRGDYIALHYTISRVPHYYADAAETIYNGDTVYVLLHRRGRYWEATRIQKTPPTAPTTFIKGRVVRGGALRSQESMLRPWSLRTRYTILYGIEKYFIPEGAGRALPRAATLSASVFVNRHGDAVLKQLFVNGHPWP